MLRSRNVKAQRLAGSIKEMQRACLVRSLPFHFTKKFRMHGVLNEVYLQNLLEMGITFRDKSNDDN